MRLTWVFIAAAVAACAFHVVGGFELPEDPAAVQLRKGQAQGQGAGGKQAKSRKPQVYRFPKAEAFTNGWVPIRVRLAKSFNASTVTLCRLDWEKHVEVSETPPSRRPWQGAMHST